MYAIAIIAIFSLSGSFLCSLMEAALYAIPRGRIETLRQAGNHGAAILAKLRAKIDEPIAAILTFNTAVNTLGAAWAGALVAQHYGSDVLGIFSGIFTASVLFFSEIIPKSLGVTYANILAPRLARVIRILIVLFWPFVKMSVVLTRLWGEESHLNFPTEDDIISLARLSMKDGGILPQEAKWVTNALRLNNVIVREIMTPKSVVYRVPDAMKLKDTKVDADHWRFSRIPVWDSQNPDRIVGVLRRREVFAALLSRDENTTFRELMHPPDFVQEDMLVHELLNHFIANRRHLICVKDKAGEFTGVVTLEDVLESLIGAEIVDESDLHEDMQKLAQEREKQETAK